MVDVTIAGGGGSSDSIPVTSASNAQLAQRLLASVNKGILGCPFNRSGAQAGAMFPPATKTTRTSAKLGLTFF